MKPVHSILSAAITVASAMAGAHVDVLPVSQRQVENRDGDRVELSDVEGVLKIAYDINVDTTCQLGHLNFK